MTLKRILAAGFAALLLSAPFAPAAQAAALTITAANVVAGTGANKQTGTAGVSVTAGQLVYLEGASNTYKLCDADSATLEVRVPAGVALNAAGAGQPLTVLTGGPITIGATVTVGLAYYSSPTAGGVSPVADMTTGVYPTFMGFAISSTVINVHMIQATVAVP